MTKLTYVYSVVTPNSDLSIIVLDYNKTTYLRLFHGSKPKFCKKIFAECVNVDFYMVFVTSLCRLINSFKAEDDSCVTFSRSLNFSV